MCIKLLNRQEDPIPLLESYGLKIPPERHLVQHFQRLLLFLMSFFANIYSIQINKYVDLNENINEFLQLTLTIFLPRGQPL